jgi:hypothetical protein
MNYNSQLGLNEGMLMKDTKRGWTSQRGLVKEELPSSIACMCVTKTLGMLRKVESCGHESAIE